ncbi:MAG: hypothetical protein M3P83_10605 [Actinomycetota bacterium]|nr:hypothetical protein [Actinomycetota bacterium]
MSITVVSAPKSPISTGPPPGWDDWRASTRGTYDYTGPTTYNINGRQVVRDGYQTDVLTNMATGLIRRNADSAFWAGARTHVDGHPLDGINLMPLVRDPRRQAGRDLLIESRNDAEPWAEYDAIRTLRWKYVEYVTGERELYDLRRDSDERFNMLPPDATAPTWVRKLAMRLAAVADCAGAGCR